MKVIRDMKEDLSRQTFVFDKNHRFYPCSFFITFGSKVNVYQRGNLSK